MTWCVDWEPQICDPDHACNSFSLDLWSVHSWLQKQISHIHFIGLESVPRQCRALFSLIKFKRGLKLYISFPSDTVQHWAVSSLLGWCMSADCSRVIYCLHSLLGKTNHTFQLHWSFNRPHIHVTLEHFYSKYFSSYQLQNGVFNLKSLLVTKEDFYLLPVFCAASFRIFCVMDLNFLDFAQVLLCHL